MGKDVLLIGIGQTGCTVCDLFLNKMNQDGLKASAIAIDTDEGTLGAIHEATTIPLIEGGELSSVVEALGAENVAKWFPCNYTEDCTDFIKTLRMDRGSNQWRMKAYLSFSSFISKNQNTERLHAALDSAAESAAGGEGLDVYVVASLAGGTGSGLFLPVSLYVKKYFNEKGVALRSKRAILTMPDIYEHCYSAEQRTKSCANAYAALREYNALLRCAYATERAEKQPPVFFKIGEEGGIPSLLFDSEKEEYRAPEANPFDRVYLLERTPGVTSVGAHAELIADVTASWCKLSDKTDSKENKNENKSDAIFGGFSLISVNYPSDCIVHYIAKKQINELFRHETTRIHKGVAAELKRRRGEAKLYGMQYVETTEQYADALVTLTDNIVAESGSALSLIGRDADKFIGDKSANEIFKLDYLSGLSAFIRKAIECEAATELERIITRPASSDTTNEKKKEKKKSAKTLRLETAELARRCGELLTDVYRHGLKVSIHEKNMMKEALLSRDTTDNGFSLVDTLLKPNGRYLHPVYGLLRLCIAYKEIERICGSSVYDPAEEPDFKRATLSDAMLCVRDVGGGSTKYARMGEERFKQLIFDEGGLYTRFADDRNEFLYDLSNVFEQLIQRIRSYCYATVLETVEDLISGYKEFISSIYGLTDEINAEEGLSLISGSSMSGTVVNVGASCAEKKAAYEAYIKTYREDPSLVSAYTEKMGACVYDAVSSRAPDASARNTALRTLEELETFFRDQCTNSEFYKKQLDKNILEVILKSIKRPDSGMTLSRAFRGRSASLHIKMPENHSEYQKVANSIVAILDTEIATFLEENRELTADRDPQNYVENLMYSAGEYFGRAEFADHIGRKTLLLRCETVNLRLDFVESVNESANGTCYKCFQLANSKRTATSTEMWNPSLIYNRGRTEQLPYIDDTAQGNYVTDVCRGVIHALSTGELYTEEIDGEHIYVRLEGVTKDPLVYEEKPIMAEKPADMLLWAHRHPEWAMTAAKRFSEKNSRDLVHLATSELDGFHPAAVAGAIQRSETFRIVADHALPLVAELVCAEDPDGYGFSEKLAELCAAVVEDLCRRVYKKTDEYFISLYNGCVTKLAQVLKEHLGLDSAKKAFTWLNECGYFRVYNHIGVRASYEFESLEAETNA